MTDEETVQPDAAEQATQETPEQQAQREEAEGQLQEGTQEQAEGSEQQDNGEEDAAAKRAKRVQKRIDQLTKQRHEALRESEESKRENAELKAKLAKYESATPPADDPRPNYDDYHSMDEFLRDYDQWGRRQGQREAKAEATQQPEPANVDQQAAMDRIENAAIEAADRYPDFEQVVYDPSLPLTQDMVNAAAETDHVADVLYHLGKNREEAQRLSQLNGTSLVREIGRLEARLEAQSSGNGAAEGQGSSQATSAPDPIKTVKGGGAKREPTNPDEMDIDTWMARERERIAKQRR